MPILPYLLSASIAAASVQAGRLSEGPNTFFVKFSPYAFAGDMEKNYVIFRLDRIADGTVKQMQVRRVKPGTDIFAKPSEQIFFDSEPCFFALYSGDHPGEKDGDVIYTGREKHLTIGKNQHFARIRSIKKFCDNQN